MAVDALIIWGCGLAAYRWYQGTAVQADIPPIYQLVVLTASLVLMVFSRSIYRSWRVNQLRVMLSSVATAWLGAMGAILVWLFLPSPRRTCRASGSWPGLWGRWGCLPAAAGNVRRAALAAPPGLQLQDRGAGGEGPTSEHVKLALAQSAWSGLRVLATLPPEALEPFLAAQQGRRQVG